MGPQCGRPHRVFVTGAMARGMPMPMKMNMPEMAMAEGGACDVVHFVDATAEAYYPLLASEQGHEAMARQGTFARCLEVRASGWLLDLHKLSPGAAISSCQVFFRSPLQASSAILRPSAASRQLRQPRTPPRRNGGRPPQK